MDKENAGRMRTIITTAVCGNASDVYQTTIHITGNENADPSRVLGCTITNAKIVDSKFENSNIENINVRVNGQFEIHIWYEVNGDTKISKNIAKFSELIQVENIEGISFIEEKCFNQLIIAKINKKSISLGTSVVNISGVPTLAIQVEYELGVEVVGEVRLKVLTYLDNPPREGDETDIPEPVFSGEEYGEDDD
ncbi:outer spore coat protein CotE [Geosporobacter ferrireducens]|uniref:Spore coat protein n=2 Tax=Geosporobacter ferrireducens TaxID=1424294 RepID=A0A1D8GKV8_9FIRM|nr:outer spore coat protein CotE [Geosporobacter ferrireducens]AOT71522.1 hypothetical protein Gferi_19495 [Geosporobacter ferrireducens]